MVEYLTVNQVVTGSSPVRGVSRLAHFIRSLEIRSFARREKSSDPERGVKRRAEGESRFMYFVYILECSNKALYTGITTNLGRRFSEHKRGKGGHYTTSNPPIKIRYSEEYKSRSEALKREAQIKRWSRTKKLALIKGDREIIKAASRCRNR